MDNYLVVLAKKKQNIDENNVISGIAKSRLNTS